MKRIYVLIILLVSAASAQEQWGNPELIWTAEPEKLEPCFTTDSSLILFTSPWHEDGARIMQLNIESPWPESYLPDSLSVYGYDDISPFMTYDGNRLYFASNRPGGFGGYDLWMMEEIDGEWTMPANLGARINTSDDETSPSLTAQHEEIYFFRGTHNRWCIVSEGHIFRSEFADGQWSDAEQLPAPVSSDYFENDPAVSTDGQKIYFLTQRPNDLPDDEAIWVSYRNGDVWSEPFILNGHINEYWEECGDWVGFPTSPAVDSAGLSMLYVKTSMFFLCIDPENEIYRAFLSTPVNYDYSTIPTHLSLSLHPNPFNSSLSINSDSNGPAKIEIFDLLGRSVMSFENQAGHNTVIWNGRDRSGNGCPTGIYFIRLSLEGRSVSRSAVLLR